MKQLTGTIFVLISLSQNLWASQGCSQTAWVGQQEVLIDLTAQTKAEGLAPYLNKDPNSSVLYQEFQEQKRPNTLLAAVGTLGTGLILSGFLTSTSDQKSGLDSRELLFISGATTLAINFLIARTYEYQNRALLKRSVEEYNKRNSPRIFFHPVEAKDKRGESSLGLGAQIRQRF